MPDPASPAAAATGTAAPHDVRQPHPVATGGLLLLFALALFFSNLGAHDLWSPDEVRYALVAREMHTTGDYVLPHLNGDVYHEKPPLMFWLTSAAAELHARLVGWAADRPAPLDRGVYVNELTARLPSAIAGLLTLLLVWRAGARRWDEWTGLTAAVILGTSVQFFWFCRTGALDAVLTLFVTVAILCGVRTIEAERGGWRWGIAVLLGMAAGLLTKGPVALLIPGLVLGAYGWATGRSRRTAVLLALAVVGAGLLVAPWWRAAFERSDGSFGNLSELWRQTRGRLVNSYSHQKPFYHYAVGVFGEFLPWSVFLPAAVWGAWRARGSVEWARLRLAWCWVVVPFVVFSAISGKRGQYLLPIYPGLALLVAAYLRRYAADLRPLARVNAIRIPAMVLVALMVGAGVGLIAFTVAVTNGALPGLAQAVGRNARWVGGLEDSLPLLRALTVPILGGGIALACLGAWAALHHMPRPPSRLVATIAAITLLIFAFTGGMVLPAFDQVKSAKPFATMVRGLAGVKTRVVLYHSFRADIAYYYGRQLEVQAPTAIGTADASMAAPLLAIIQDKNYRRLRDQIPDSFVIVHQARIGSRTWFLLSNRPPAT